MFRLIKWVVVVAVAVVVALAVAGFGYVRSTGLRARAKPAAMETHVARAVRSLAVPGRERERRNPVAQSDEAMRGALEHYADHCATCHANDGGGNTEMGRGLYPPAPDMRLAATQQLSDGELFYVIEHGIRFTGMPGWRTGTTAGEESSWHLVHFIRHLPTLTPAELDSMKARNPRSPEDIRFEIEEERFLNEGAQK